MKLLAIIAIIYLIKISNADDCKNKIKNTKELSEGCSKQLEILCDHHDILLTLWDSSSRILHPGLTSIPSDEFNKDFGNFDLCMRIDEDINDVTLLGKFCPLTWGTAIPRQLLEDFIADFEISQKIGSHQFENIISADNSNDTVNILGSICIPDGCSIDEFTKVFNPYLSIFKVEYAEKNKCLTKHTDKDLSGSELVIAIFLGLIALTVVVCTCIHITMHNIMSDEPHDFIKAFSVFYNGTKLFTISTNRVDQIQCMNGIRFLSMLWVIAGHSFVSFEMLPHTNQRDVHEWRTHLYSQYITAAVYAVDTFFFLSGFLLAYGYFKQTKDMDTSKLVKGVPLMYLHRYLRLSPALAAMILFSVSLLKIMGNGPVWLTTYHMMTDSCRTYWWRYIFYIHNYFPAKEMCWEPTWYLGADMQMFFLAPFVLIPSVLYFNKNKRLVIGALSALIVFCVGISIAVRYIVKDYDNDFDTHSRLSAYFVGIIGGLMMFRNKGKHIKISRVVNLLIWLVVFCVMLFLILYLYDVNEHPTKVKTTIYSVMYRPVWALCMLWIVFACQFGYGGFINSFLSYPLFQIGARLSYSMYIVHCVVITFFIGELRTSLYFDDYQVYYQICGHVITAVFVSILWTFIFEGPMILLDKMLFSWIDSLLNKKKTKTIA